MNTDGVHPKFGHHVALSSFSHAQLPCKEKTLQALSEIGRSETEESFYIT